MKSLAASLALVLLVVTGALGLVGHLAFSPPHAAPRELALAAPHDTSPTAPPASRLRQPIPTVTPRPRVTPASLPRVTPTPAPPRAATEAFEAWSAPVPASLPTATSLARAGCDPAYPEARTCIPPGPPFGQGCAITDERLFTALPPDPQRLDHDSDGIGCEPI